jgi:hypothetical protein
VAGQHGLDQLSPDRLSRAKVPASSCSMSRL